MKWIFAACASLATLASREALGGDYRSAVEGSEVVKGKFYPRGGRFQLNPAQAGIILNQSFVDTYLLSLRAVYHVNEWHAVGLDAFYGISRDREERDCIENFYFNPERARNAGAAEDCEPGNSTDAKKPGAADERKPEASGISDADWEGEGSTHTRADGRVGERYRVGPFQRKPAYMPIRVIKQMYTLNYEYTPVYGKAIWLLSVVGYMDFFGTAGVGVAMSDFYPSKSKVPCSKNALGGQLGDGAVGECDVASEGTNLAGAYGKANRPKAIAQTSPLLHAGIGSRFYLGPALWTREDDPAPTSILANFELRNFTVFGSDPNGEAGIMNFFALWGGVGIIF